MQPPYSLYWRRSRYTPNALAANAAAPLGRAQTNHTHHSDEQKLALRGLGAPTPSPRRATMTNKQAAFVQNYLTNLNATEAAAKAGYSDPNYGRQLITKPNVKQAIDDALVARAKRARITADEVIDGLASIAQDDEATASARVRAYELLGKHLGITFTDTVQTSGEQTVRVVRDDP